MLLINFIARTWNHLQVQLSLSRNYWRCVTVFRTLSQPIDPRQGSIGIFTTSSKASTCGLLACFVILNMSLHHCIYFYLEMCFFFKLRSQYGGIPKPRSEHASGDFLVSCFFFDMTRSNTRLTLYPTISSIQDEMTKLQLFQHFIPAVILWIYRFHSQRLLMHFFLMCIFWL